MSVFDDVSRVRYALGQLDPHGFKATKKQLERGGLPSSSVPEAVSGTRDYEPDIDVYDRRLWAAWDTFCGEIRKAAESLERAQRAQTGVMLKADPVPEETLIPCSNLACDQVLEEGRKKGECPRCRKHRQRNNRPYPQVAA